MKNPTKEGFSWLEKFNSIGIDEKKERNEAFDKLIEVQNEIDRKSESSMNNKVNFYRIFLTVLAVGIILYGLYLYLTHE